MNDASRFRGDSVELQSSSEGTRGGLIARAETHAAAGRFGEALSIVRDASTGKPQDVDVLFAEAFVLSAWGRIHDVCIRCQQGWVVDSGHVPLFLTLGWSCLSLGKPADAEEWIRRATDAAPANWRVHFSLGVVLRQLNRLEEAIASYERALALQPDNFDSRVNLGVCRLQQGDLKGAESEARLAIALDGARANAWENLGVVLAKQDKHGQAAEAFARAMKIETEFGDDSRTFINAASNLLEMDDVESALALYESNLEQHPSYDGHHDYAIGLLTGGRLIEGWNHYEFRWIKNPLLSLRPRFQKPRWAGQSLQGKTILLLPEQGFGDVLQFIRYAPFVKALGAKVVLSVPDGFGALAAHFPGIDVAVATNGPLPSFDFYIQLLSLPRVFGTDVGSIPACVPYLQPDPRRVEYWAREMRPNDRRLKVGLVWAGRPTLSADRRRSIPFNALEPLCRLNGVRYFGLQKDATAKEAQTPIIDGDFVNLGQELRDFGDTAAVIANLDLVVCVDTAVAHLAGAMGKPVWVLLSRPADFRWMREREDTPWYPTMRLFRQDRSGEWSGVIQRVKTALDRLLEEEVAAAAPQTRFLDTATLVPRPTLVRLSPGHRKGLSAVAETRAGIVQYFPEETLVGDSIDWYGEYLQGQLNVLGGMLKPGMTLIEVDSGVGMHALYLAEAVGPSGQMYLYETRAPMRTVLRQNLAANRIGSATVMNRSLGGAGTSNINAAVDAVDDLQLEHLHLLKFGGQTPASEILTGATETLWRLRPLLFVPVKNDGALRELGRRVCDLGYRCWRMETPLFNAANFNRRDENIFAGKIALAIMGVPEEIGLDMTPTGCREIVW